MGSTLPKTYQEFAEAFMSDDQENNNNRALIMSSLRQDGSRLALRDPKELTTVAHWVAGCGWWRTAPLEQAVRRFPDIYTWRDAQNETVLHAAAQVGYLGDMIGELEESPELLQQRNARGISVLEMDFAFYKEKLRTGAYRRHACWPILLKNAANALSSKLGQDLVLMTPRHENAMQIMVMIGQSYELSRDV